MPGSRPCCCRTQWIQLGALAGILQPGGGLECVPGVRVLGSQAHTLQQRGRADFPRLSGPNRTQEMVSGYYLPTPGSPTRTGTRRPRAPLPIPGPGECQQPPHLGNGLLPPRASRKKDPGANERQTELGTPRQFRGGQAGRQADWGRSLWSLANAGAYCRGFSRAGPGSSSGAAVGMRTGQALPYSPPWATPCSPHPSPELWAGLSWVAVEPHSASLGTSEASARQMGQVRLAFNHLSTHLAWNSWLQGRTRSSCRTSKSLKQTTHRVCSD